jgi:hypothetical protein
MIDQRHESYQVVFGVYLNFVLQPSARSYSRYFVEYHDGKFNLNLFVGSKKMQLFLKSNDVFVHIKPPDSKNENPTTRPQQK